MTNLDDTQYCPTCEQYARQAERLEKRVEKLEEALFAIYQGQSGDYAERLIISKALGWHILARLQKEAAE